MALSELRKALPGAGGKTERFSALRAALAPTPPEDVLENFREQERGERTFETPTAQPKRPSLRDYDPKARPAGFPATTASGSIGVKGGKAPTLEFVEPPPTQVSPAQRQLGLDALAGAASRQVPTAKPVAPSDSPLAPRPRGSATATPIPAPAAPPTSIAQVNPFNASPLAGNRPATVEQGREMIAAANPSDTTPIDRMSTAGKSLSAGFGDVAVSAASAARLAGFDDAADKIAAYGKEVQDLYGADIPDVAFEGLRSLIDPDYLATKGARALAFPLALAPAAIGGAYAAGGLATAAGAGALGTTIAASVGGALASRPLESAMEAGGVYEEAKARGMSEAEAKKSARTAFWRNNALVVMDAGELLLALAPLPQPLKKVLGAVDMKTLTGVKKAAVGAGRVAGTGLLEAIEEVDQDAISRESLGDKFVFDKQAQEAAALGFGMGGGMGAVGSAFNLGDRDQAQPIPGVTPATDTTPPPTQASAASPVNATVEETVERPISKQGKQAAKVHLDGADGDVGLALVHARNKAALAKRDGTPEEIALAEDIVRELESIQNGTPQVEVPVEAPEATQSQASPVVPPTTETSAPAPAKSTAKPVTVGMKVKALDRGNIGTVSFVNPDTGEVKVSFRNKKDGTSGSRTFPSATLLRTTSGGSLEIPNAVAPATASPTTPPPTDRLQVLRDANPGMDERAIQDLAKTTANLSDAEFTAFAARVGKPEAAPTENAAQAQQNDSDTPGAPLKNGFYRGPKPHMRYKIHPKVTSVQNGVLIEKRWDNTGNDDGMYVMKNGTFGPAPNINSPEIFAIWQPATEEQRQQAVEVIEKMMPMDLNDPKRAALAEQLKAIVTGAKAAPAETPATSPDAPLPDYLKDSMKVIEQNGDRAGLRPSAEEAARQGLTARQWAIGVEQGKKQGANDRLDLEAYYRVVRNSMGLEAGKAQQPQPANATQTPPTQAPEGYTQAKRKGEKGKPTTSTFTVADAEKFATELRAQGKEAVVIVSPKNPKTRQVWVAPAKAEPTTPAKATTPTDMKGLRDHFTKIQEPLMWTKKGGSWSTPEGYLIRRIDAKDRTQVGNSQYIVTFNGEPVLDSAYTSLSDARSAAQGHVQKSRIEASGVGKTPAPTKVEPAKETSAAPTTQPPTDATDTPAALAAGRIKRLGAKEAIAMTKEEIAEARKDLKGAAGEDKADLEAQIAEETAILAELTKNPAETAKKDDEPEASKSKPMNTTQKFTLYRTGNPDEYTEFTDDGRMTGGRGTGHFGSGQYAFSSPGENRVAVRGPENPLIFTNPDTAQDFHRWSQNLLRAAQGMTLYAGDKNATLDDKVSSLHISSIGTKWKASEDEIRAVIETWQKHKMVHPINIHMGNKGYDGIVAQGDAIKGIGDNGDYGNVSWPELDGEGKPVGLEKKTPTYWSGPSRAVEDMETATETPIPARAERAGREIITPANDTPVGRNAAGEQLYERTDGSRYRMRLDRKDRPDGYPDFGGDLVPADYPDLQPTKPTPADDARYNALVAARGRRDKAEGPIQQALAEAVESERPLREQEHERLRKLLSTKTGRQRFANALPKGKGTDVNRDLRDKLNSTNTTAAQLADMVLERANSLPAWEELLSAEYRAALETSRKAAYAQYQWQKDAEQLDSLDVGKLSKEELDALVPIVPVADTTKPTPTKTTESTESTVEGEKKPATPPEGYTRYTKGTGRTFSIADADAAIADLAKQGKKAIAIAPANNPKTRQVWVEPGKAEEAAEEPIRRVKLTKEVWEMKGEEWTKLLSGMVPLQQDEVRRQYPTVEQFTEVPNPSRPGQREATQTSDWKRVTGLKNLQVVAAKNSAGLFTGGGFIQPVLTGGKDSRYAWTPEEVAALQEAADKLGVVIRPIRYVKGVERDVKPGEGFMVVPKGTRRLAVEHAIRNGESIPPEVLKDYPDLAPTKVELEKGKEAAAVDEETELDTDEDATIEEHPEYDKAERLADVLGSLEGETDSEVVADLRSDAEEIAAELGYKNLNALMKAVEVKWSDIKKGDESAPDVDQVMEALFPNWADDIAESKATAQTPAEARPTPTPVEAKKTWQMTTKEFDDYWVDRTKENLKTEVAEKLKGIDKEIARLTKMITPGNPGNAAVRDAIEKAQQDAQQQKSRLTEPIKRPSEFMSEAQLRYHRGIDDAKKAGETFSPEVLADYPDLRSPPTATEAPTGWKREKNGTAITMTKADAEAFVAKLQAAGKTAVMVQSTQNQRVWQVYSEPVGAKPSVKESLRGKVESVEGKGIIDPRLGIVAPGTAGQSKRAPVGVDVPATNPAVEERWAAAEEKAKPEPLKLRFKKGWEVFKARSSRDLEFLPRGARFAEVSNKMRQLKKGKGIASDEAALYLQGITVEMNRDEFKLFRRAVAYRNMIENISRADAERAENGEGSLPTDTELQFGFTPDELRKEWSRVEAAMKDNPSVSRAFEDRQKVWKEVTGNYAAEYEKLHGKQPPFDREYYFRQEVIARMTQDSMEAKTDAGEVNAKRSKSWLKKRGDKFMDFSNRYLEVEHKVLTEMLYETQKYKLLNFINESENVVDKLKEDAKAKSEETGTKVTWRELIPEGYTTYQPEPGDQFFHAWSIADRYVQKAMEEALESVDVPIDKVREVWARGSRKAEWVIPKEIAQTLKTLHKVIERRNIDGAVKKGMRYYKQHQLLFATRVVKYNIRNISGDIDGTIAGNPSSFRRLPQAVSELWSMMYRGSAPTAELEAWISRGGAQDIMQVQESIVEMDSLKQFKQLMEKKGLLERMKEGEITAPLKEIRRVWREFAIKGTAFREYILRYANFLDYMAQLDKNAGKPDNYGASIPEEIDAVSAFHDKAYKLSNDLLGAYDEVSVYGQDMADYAWPFWRWNAVNHTRYTRIIKNAFRDGEGTSAVGRAAAGKLAGIAIKSPVIAYRVGKMVVAVSAATAMMSAWNHLFFRDEEEELPPHVRGRAHMILGIPGVPGSARDKDGKVRAFTRMGSLTDWLEWFGVVDSPMYVQEYMNGKMTLKDIVVDMVKAPVNKVWQGIGPVRTVIEGAIGKTSYPDVFRPRTIRDRYEFFADSLALGDFYRELAGKPTRGIGSVIEGSLYYKYDGEEVAYNEILGLKYNWLEKTKGTKFEGAYGAKANAAYYLKQSIRYSDREAFEKYLTQYKAYGGTAKGLKATIERMHPLAGLSKADQARFLEQLSDADRERLTKAIGFYRDVLAK